jgi:drug/metabolite transporter (DMT)-like permease
LSNLRLFVACVAIWGTTWLAIKFQLGVVAPEASVGYRFLIASLLLFVYCRARRLPLRFSRRDHAWIALQGLLMFGASYVFVYYAEQHLPSGLVAVGYSASPLVNLAVSRVAFGTRATAGVAVGGLMGVAGIALVFWPEISRAEAGAGALAGGALTAAGVLSSSIGNVFATRLDRLGVNVWQKMAWGMAYGAAGCAAAALASGQGLSFQWTPGYVLSLLYLAFLGSIGAFAAYLTLLARVGAARAGYVGVMTPIVALAISGIVERFSWGPLTLAGVAVAVAGNVVMLRSR